MRLPAFAQDAKNKIADRTGANRSVKADGQREPPSEGRQEEGSEALRAQAECVASNSRVLKQAATEHHVLPFPNT